MGVEAWLGYQGDVGRSVDSAMMVSGLALGHIMVYKLGQRRIIIQCFGVLFQHLN